MACTSHSKLWTEAAPALDVSRGNMSTLSMGAVMSAEVAVLQYEFIGYELLPVSGDRKGSDNPVCHDVQHNI